MARVQNPKRVRILPAVTAGLLTLSVLILSVVSYAYVVSGLVRLVSWDNQWYSYVGMGAIVLFVAGWSLVASVFIWRLTNGKA